MQSKFFIPSKKVEEALANGKPILALESTIIAHGMPYPQNLETAMELENLAHDHGVTPATIAVIDGIVRIGLERQELETIASPDSTVMKLSTRDLPYAISKKLTGATTVAATMFCAAEAGIAVFATGGIGGVHRYGEETFDVSADLTELSRTKVAVVCAGAKAILDIPKTLEYLETQSVPVIGYQTSDFPAFYSQKSGENCPYSFDSCEGIAEFLKVQWKIGLPGGALVANPIPQNCEIPNNVIAPHIHQALTEAKNKNISGKATTPFLLKRLAELTKGQSLEANIALVKHNVNVASQLARLLS